MDRIGVSARSKLLDYIQGSGRKLTYGEKDSQERLTAIAAEIFKLPADVGLVKMVAAVTALGSAKRRKRRQEYRAKNLAKLKAAERRECSKPAQPRPERSVKMADEIRIRNFYDSWEWKQLSFDVKVERGRICECCGARPPDVRIITDHIKPLRHYWHLRLEKTNLQVLCDDCNRGKGSRHETDFRIGLSAAGPRLPPVSEVWDR